MKRYLYLFFVPAFLFACPTFGQNNIGGLSLGVKAGLSVPNLTAGETENVWNKDYGSIRGPYFSIFAEYKIGKYLYIQPSLAYCREGGQRNNIQPMTIPGKYLEAFQKAFKTDKDYLFANLNSESRLNYIQLPIMLKFQYPIAFKGRLQVFVQAGPYVGYLMTSKRSTVSKDLHVYRDDSGQEEIPQGLVKTFFGDSIDTTVNTNDQLHRWNVGVQGGIGLAWISEKSEFFIEGGGNYGFIPVQMGDEHGKNNIGAATIVVGYMRTIHW